MVLELAGATGLRARALATAARMQAAGGVNQLASSHRIFYNYNDRSLGSATAVAVNGLNFLAIRSARYEVLSRSDLPPELDLFPPALRYQVRSEPKPALRDFGRTMAESMAAFQKCLRTLPLEARGARPSTIDKLFATPTIDKIIPDIITEADLKSFKDKWTIEPMTLPGLEPPRSWEDQSMGHVEIKPMPLPGVRPANRPALGDPGFSIDIKNSIIFKK